MKNLIIIISILFVSLSSLANDAYRCKTKEVNSLGINVLKNETINKEEVLDNFFFKKLENRIILQDYWFVQLSNLQIELQVNYYDLKNDKEFFKGTGDNIFFEYQDGKFWYSVLNSNVGTKTIVSIYAECKKD